jgi:hypothetical protein
MLDADSMHDKSRPSLRNSKMPINSNQDELKVAGENKH